MSVPKGKPIASHWRAKHASGSKFYEIVLIAHGDQVVELRRWGKIANQEGGGQSSCTIHEDHGLGLASISGHKKSKEKGGYTNIPTKGSLLHADLVALENGGIDCIEEFLSRSAAQTVYGTPNAIQFKKQVVAKWGLTHPPRAEAAYVPPAPVVEPPRSQDWGSW